MHRQNDKYKVFCIKFILTGRHSQRFYLYGLTLPGYTKRGAQGLSGGLSLLPEEGGPLFSIGGAPSSVTCPIALEIKRDYYFK